MPIIQPNLPNISRAFAQLREQGLITQPQTILGNGRPHQVLRGNGNSLIIADPNQVPATSTVPATPTPPISTTPTATIPTTPTPPTIPTPIVAPTSASQTIVGNGSPHQVLTGTGNSVIVSDPTQVIPPNPTSTISGTPPPTLSAMPPTIATSPVTLGDGNVNASLSGKDGQIRLNQTGAPDAIVTPTPNVVINGGNGSDRLEIGNLGTGVQSVTFKGGSGNNVVDGTKSNAPLTLEGGKGNDILKGGPLNDTFIWNPGEGSQRISGGGGNDTSITNGAKAGHEVMTLRGQGQQFMLDRVTQKPFNITGDHVENVTVNSQGPGDILSVGSGLNKAGVQTLTFTSQGGSILDASQADAHIIATGRSGDTLIGGTKNNTLTGAGGVLVGGTGHNTFNFDTGKAFNLTEVGTSTIANFKAGDQISLGRTTFAGINPVNGVLKDSDFATVNSDAEATVSKSLITYSRGSGGLFYNSGAAAGLPQNSEFAVVAGAPQIDARSFAIH